MYISIINAETFVWLFKHCFLKVINSVLYRCTKCIHAITDSHILMLLNKSINAPECRIFTSINNEHLATIKRQCGIIWIIGANFHGLFYRLMDFVELPVQKLCSWLVLDLISTMWSKQNPQIFRTKISNDFTVSNK